MFTCNIIDLAVHTGKVRDAKAQHARLGPQVTLLSTMAAAAFGTEPGLSRFTIHLEPPARAHTHTHTHIYTGLLETRLCSV